MTIRRGSRGKDTDRVEVGDLLLMYVSHRVFLDNRWCPLLIIKEAFHVKACCDSSCLGNFVYLLRGTLAADVQLSESIGLENTRSRWPIESRHCTVVPVGEGDEQK